MCYPYNHWYSSRQDMCVSLLMAVVKVPEDVSDHGKNRKEQNCDIDNGSD